MNKERHAILYNDEQLGPYPLEKLRRGDRITTERIGMPSRRREDESVDVRAAKGEFGEKVRLGAMEFIDKEPIFRAYFDVNNALGNIELDPVAPVKSELPDDPEVLTRHIKKLCYFMGTDMVGICRLPQEVFYSHNAQGEELPPQDYKYAIVLLCGKTRETVYASYGNEWIDDAVSMQVYQKLVCQSTVLASYIRRMGYPASVNAVPKYSAIMPRLVLEAGLGEGSRMGIAVNPFLGALIKTAAVFTDLPLVPDKPIDFGLQEYCEKCRICADNCLVNAIPHGPKEEFNGYLTWHIKPENCAVHTRTNRYGKVCERCVKLCPWSRPDCRPEDFANWDGDIKYLHESADRRAKWLKEHDYICDEENGKKWWFPMRWKDGRYVMTEEWDYDMHYRRFIKKGQVK
jgi:ferredoxin